jgi:hypothetical protein
VKFVVKKRAGSLLQLAFNASTARSSVSPITHPCASDRIELIPDIRIGLAGEPRVSALAESAIAGPHSARTYRLPSCPMQPSTVRMGPGLDAAFVEIGAERHIAFNMIGPAPSCGLHDFLIVSFFVADALPPSARSVISYVPLVTSP